MQHTSKRFSGSLNTIFSITTVFCSWSPTSRVCPIITSNDS